MGHGLFLGAGFLCSQLPGISEPSAVLTCTGVLGLLFLSLLMCKMKMNSFHSLPRILESSDDLGALKIL